MTNIPAYLSAGSTVAVATVAITSAWVPPIRDRLAKAFRRQATVRIDAGLYHDMVEHLVKLVAEDARRRGGVYDG
jgi:hypothetical protein